MKYVGRKSKYNVGDILPDGRKILEIKRESETNYLFLLYCDKCKTEKWVKRQDGLRRECIGCGGKIWRYETQKEKKINKSFTNYKYSANKRGYDFFLTRTEFISLISKSCYWCGNNGLVGVDRLDNEHGYTSENSVPCCKRCNYAKSDMSINEWYEWISRIAKYNSK